jgi:uncharacterized protein
VLAIHSASASFKEQPAYPTFLGGRFTHHGEIQNYRVDPAPVVHSIFGIAAPFTLHDELYYHEWDESNTIHFWANTPTGREPLVWTRYNGEGRICYCAAGHSAASLSTPQIQQVLIRGLRWAASKEY